MRNTLNLFISISIICTAMSCNSKKVIIPEKINNSVSFSQPENGFLLANKQSACPIISMEKEFTGVSRTIEKFATDIEMITGSKPELIKDSIGMHKKIVIIGTLGKNPLIDSLAESGKIQSNLIKNKWEASLVQVVENPFNGVEKALIIAGSDKRGTIYGMYGLSRTMGVSPWYWWADVPVKKSEAIYIKPGVYTDGEPSVQYRGIFINDEAPSLEGWAFEKYGSFNSEFYEKVFELILRHKGNFLWPAMWGHSFNLDDTLNPVLADEYGIVIGTSHHEPMNRAHVDWEHYGKGPWDYNKNAEVLDEFWRFGIENTLDYETIVTLGMRGDGDEPMSEESNIELLKRIIHNQREIIKNVTNQPVENQPQVWALYKEVMEYYDKGLRVPDDITLLLCDDNWGNVRKLPELTEANYPGGYGMYYHFDYVGGPRNYKWINKSVIPRIWEQMHLTYEHGVDKLWIVNVGDIKPMELPITFFLDYAWRPEDISLESVPKYATNWAEEQFGNEYAEQIADFLTRYTHYNSRRTPEMLNDETYSLINYREFERVVDDYNILAKNAEEVAGKIDAKYSDAYFQLVLFPIKASANLYNLYYYTALNKLYAAQKRASTNTMTEKVRCFYDYDSILTHKYNKVIADGKWNHIMDQTHIGYTNWQQPPRNTIPKTLSYKPQRAGKSGLWIEGEQTHTSDNDKLEMPLFSRYGRKSYFFELYNMGEKEIKGEISTNAPWIKLSHSNDFTIKDQIRVEVGINWELMSEQNGIGTIDIRTSDREYTINVLTNSYTIDEFSGFIGADGYISMEAENYTNKSNRKGFSWKHLSNIGRTSGGMFLFPVNKSPENFNKQSPWLEYSVFIPDSGSIDVHALFSPTLDYLNIGGIKFALSMDDQLPKIVNLHKDAVSTSWYDWVGNNIIETKTSVNINQPGAHKLKIYAIDGGIVLQKLILDFGGLKDSYLGPPQSFRLRK